MGREDLALGLNRPLLTRTLFVVWLFLAPAPLTPGPPGDRRRADDAGQWIEAVREVFVGRVVGRQVYSDDGDILTRYTLSVVDALPGGPPAVVEIVEFGGTMGDTTMAVSHAAQLQLDSDYLVFAWTDDMGRKRPLGGQTGVLRVVRDQTGRRSVRMGPDHPVRALLRGPGTFLVDLNEVLDVIRDGRDAVQSARD